MRHAPSSAVRGAGASLKGRVPMGHDIHFLQRLERVSLQHVELAMSLYHDPPMVEAILRRVKLPDTADSVAISLDDPERGPFIIVNRKGRFVTCLGEGMRVEPMTPIINRQRLNSIVDKVDGYRERAAEASNLAGRKGRVHQLLHRIYTAADELSREEFIAIAAWQPLLGAEFLRQLLLSIKSLNTTRLLLRKIDRPPKQYDLALREYWNNFWAVGHLSLLAGMDARELLPQMPALAEYLAMGESLTLPIVRQGFLPLVLRAAWLAGKLGKLGFGCYKLAHEKAQDPLEVTDTAAGLLALAVRHSGLRGEIRKILERCGARNETPVDQSIGRICTLAQIALNLCLDKPDEYQQLVAESGRMLYLDLARQRPEGGQVTPAQLAGVRDDLLLPALAGAPLCFLGDPGETIHALMMLPHAVRAQPEEFYFTRADLAAVSQPWRPEDSLRLLRIYRDRCFGGAVTPVRSVVTPGRNDPCPCRSGKKYKRCCIVSQAAAA